MAGIGGALLTQANQNWDTATFNPVFGLFWFVVVVVCGVATVRGAILAGVLYVLIPRWLNLDIGSAIGLFGLGAVFLGRLPGGVIAQAARLGQVLSARLAEQYKIAKRPAPPPPPDPVLTPFAERVLAERGQR